MVQPVDNLSTFFSLPMDAQGPQNDQVVGQDEFGRLIYQGQNGSRYVMTERPRMDMSNALAYAVDNPWETAKGVAGAIVEGAWNGIEAPGNALRGETLTYGDVADTALDWGVMGAVGRAPEGALRSMAWNDLPMYHGTPDVRDLRTAGGFQPRTRSVSYITDPDRWDELQAAMREAVPQSDEYFRLLDEAGALRGTREIVDPVFLSPDRRVAASYADDSRAFDYQNAEAAVVEAVTNPTNPLDVYAGGDTFRGISQDRVARALTEAGIPEQDVNRAIRSLSHTRNGRMSTDDLAIVANDLGFDAVDVANVVDTYNATGAPGRVRMMLNPGQIDVPAFRPPETPAQSIARLLREDPSQVTDDMLGALTPNDNMELARLYEGGATGMPMPMDEASRMSRAGEMGFDTDTPLYHGTGVDYPSFDPSARGSSTGAASARRADWLTTDPSEASAYADVAEQSIPTNRIQSAMNAAERRRDWGEHQRLIEQWEAMDAAGYEGGNVISTLGPSDAAQFDAGGAEYFNITPEINGALRDARNSSASGLRLNDIRDHPVSSAAHDPTTHVAVFDPTNIRSRFARFDPRLRHLANLSAGVAAGGMMLPFVSEEDNALSRLEAYLNQ